MLGQAHTPRRWLLPVAAFALAVLVAPAVGGANPAHSVSTLRAHDAAIAAQSRSASLGLYALDSQLSAARSRLASLQHQTEGLRAERASLALQLHVARRGARLAQKRLGDRLRALYDQNGVEPLEIVFGAKSLDEAMTSLDNLSRVAGQGEDVVQELHDAKSELGKTARELATRESALAAATREAQATVASLEQTRAQRAAYIESLSTERQMTQRQIASAVSVAHAAEVRTVSLQHEQATVVAHVVSAAASAAPIAAVTAAPPVAASAGHTLTVSATGYALGGRTASGLPVGWGIAAVDPSVIPLGTHFTVPGYGEAVAADTGGAIVGSTIDLWFPTVAQANAWGRRTVTIVLH